MEIWDLYTRGRVRSGRLHERGQRIPEGFYHLVVHVWIRNREGRYLISRRAADRETFPLKWETVGGSVLAGEDSIGGAVREAGEEVGVCLQPQDGRLIDTVTGRRYGGREFQDILDVWLFEYDGEAELNNASSREVCEVQWMTREEIRALYESGELVHTLGYFFETVEPEKESV